MARRPSRSQVSRARKAQASDPWPIRFVADYDHVTVQQTVVYRAGRVLDNPDADLRTAALASGRAVKVNDGK